MTTAPLSKVRVPARANGVGVCAPAGTASNYFTGRDDLVNQVGGRVYERLRPSAAQLADAKAGPADRTKPTALMQELVGRLSAFPSGYLALVELRLEAIRRPPADRPGRDHGSDHTGWFDVSTCGSGTSCARPAC
jgi:hypothetical protein